MNNAYKISFHALCMWHAKLFKKLGWIVVCFERDGNTEEAQMYAKKIAKFIAAVNANMGDFSADKQRDLAIMKDDATILLNHVKKDFNLQAGGARRRSSKRSSKSKAASKGRK